MRLQLHLTAAASLVMALATPLVALRAANPSGSFGPRITAAVAGRITDRAGEPIVDVIVSITELGRSARTDRDGRFRLSGLPSGRYTVSVRRIGYASVARVVDVAAVSVTLDIALEAGVVRIEPVNVTSMRAPIASAASPLATSILTGEQVHPDGGISLAHSVAQLAGVRNVSSGQQVGKPMIRGLFGPRVLVLTDGSRLEDYSWSNEDGPSLDARLAQRVEVIRGPASVLYGSEAIGGVVNVIPADLPSSADGSKFHRTGLEAYGGSNNTELGTAGMIEGAQGRYGFRATATGRFALDVQTPRGKLQNSSFWAFNSESAFGIDNAHGSTVIRGAHYGGEFHLLESKGPEAGDSTGGPVRQTLDDRLQVTNNYVVSSGLRFETKAQYQRHALTEVSDDCQPAPGQTTCAKVKDQQAFGLVLNTGTVDLLAHHSTGDHVTGTVGISGMYQLSGTSGPIFLVPGATTSAGGIFAFEQVAFGSVSLVGGARADARRLSSDASPALALAADSRNWSNASGDVGIVIHALPELSLVANLGTGWRAPTLFDLYTNGPNVGDARYEIGSPALRAERDHSVDGGLRWMSNRARGEVTVFRNTVNDFIYTAPTTQTISGLRVFRHQQTNARLTGAEFSASVDLADPLAVRASYDFVNGTDAATGVALPFMPPPRTILGIDLHSARLGWATRASVGAELEINATQMRLAPSDVASNGYTLLNLNFSMERMVRARPIRFGVDVRNATNTSYTDFLSRYKSFAYGPGVNLIFKATAGDF